MKNLTLAAVMLFCAPPASAQSKIGHINTEELIGFMPETIQFNKDLEKYQNSLITEGLDLSKDLNNDTNNFVRDSINMTRQAKEALRTGLTNRIQRLQNYEAEIQEKVNLYIKQKGDPIRTKAIEAIKAVAAEKGYSYVLDSSTSTLILSPPGDDLMPLVKARLGIGVSRPGN